MSDRAFSAVHAGARGLTLVELMVAMSLMSFVALIGLVAVNALAQLSSDEMIYSGQLTEVERGLRLVVRDVRRSAAIEVETDRLILGFADGSFAVYERSSSADELHRLSGATRTDALANADLAAIHDRGPVLLRPDGILHDADYLPSALLQGLSGISWRAIDAPSTRTTIGIKIEAQAGPPSALRRISRVACSLELTEQTLGY